MADLDIKNTDNKSVGQVSLDPAIFDVPMKETLVWEDVCHYQAEGRQGSASTKTRAEVSGGGRKLWRQKGTGRARMGSNRSPLWRKGGITFGPRPRDYGYSFPKKKRWGALRVALSDQVRQDGVMVIDEFVIDKPSTRSALSTLKALGLQDRKVLVVDEPENDFLSLSVRNLPRVRTQRPMALRSYHILDAQTVLFTKRGLEVLVKGMPK